MGKEEFTKEQLLEKLQQTEIALHDYEEITNIMSDQPLMGILIVQGVPARVAYANKTMARLLGYSPDQLASIKVADLFNFLTTEERAVFAQRYRDLMSGKSVPLHNEFQVRRPDNSTVGVAMYASRIEYGGQPATLAIVLDITERQKSEAALQISETKYRSLFEGSRDAVFITTVEGRFLDFNQAMIDLLGYPRAELMNLDVRQAYAEPADRDKFQAIMEKNGLVHNYEITLRRKDGATVDCLFTSTTWRDPTGKVLSYQGIIRDITEKKRAVQALKESEAQYRTTINSMGDAIHAVDQDLRIILFNDAFKKWNRELGLTNDVYGRDIFEVFPFLPPKVRDEYRHVLRNGEILITQGTSRIGDREIITETRKIPVFEGSKVTRVITMIRDITNRYKAEEEFKENALKMRRILEETTYTLASTVEKRDPYTAGHQQRVAQLAHAIAREMGLAEDQIDGIKMAALIHDIGKIYVPAEILNKPGRLTDIEYNLIKAHPQLSYDILKTIEFPWPVALTILQHHERANGSGYPSGLTAQTIIQEAKILAVADVVEAIYSNRPYRPARGIEKALEEITNNKETLYDSEVVDACIRLFDKKDFKFE
jgi:PAS domain S-box-containing protein/putative nucleotidyltransferase with HDIG domain